MRSNLIFENIDGAIKDNLLLMIQSFKALFLILRNENLHLQNERNLFSMKMMSYFRRNEALTILKNQEFQVEYQVKDYHERITEQLARLKSR